MLELEIENSYKRDLKLAYEQDIVTNKIEIELKFVIETLRGGKILLDRLYSPRTLSGEYSGYTGCHIKADFCLIYKITDKVLHLVRVGKYATIYKNS